MKLILSLIPILSIFSLESEACCKKKDIGGCCGNGPCNIFCCNCDRGCDTNCNTDWKSIIETAANVVGRKKRDIAQDYFHTVDFDADGVISLQEAETHLANHEVVKRHIASRSEGGTHPEWFAVMDVDGNGFISPAEFDHNLA